MKKVAALIALAGLATAASAQVNGINVMVRVAGTTEWLEAANYQSQPGDTTPAHIEVAVFYKRASGFGFSGSVHNVVIGGGWDDAMDSVTLLDRTDSAQHPDGRQGRFNFGAQRQASYAVGGGGRRIAAGNNTQDALGGGISVKQNTPGASGTAFDQSNPAFGFRFDLTLACRPDQVITTYDLSTPLNRIANFSIYNASDSTSGTNVPVTSLILKSAIIRTQWLVPAPGSMALLGLGGLAAIRRRR